MKFKIKYLNSIQFYEAVLHLAYKKGNLEIIKLLLKKENIDINIEDSQGKKPIYYSANHHQTPNNQAPNNQTTQQQIHRHHHHHQVPDNQAPHRHHHHHQTPNHQ